VPRGWFAVPICGSLTHSVNSAASPVCSATINLLAGALVAVENKRVAPDEASAVGPAEIGEPRATTGASRDKKKIMLLWPG